MYNPAAASPDPMTPRFLEVRRVIRETADTVTLQFHDPDARPFKAGQFNMLYLFGGGEAAISISGGPASPGKLEHTVRAVGSVTKPLAELRRGAMVGVRGPFGSSWPLEEAARRGCDLLLLGGGIGLAPLRPVIYEVHCNRNRYGRMTLLCGARNPAELLYGKEVPTWRRPRTHVRSVVDHGDLSWRGRIGVLTDLLAEVSFDPLETIADVRPRSNDPLCRARVEPARNAAHEYLCFIGTQYEVRRRLVRPLHVGGIVRVQGRADFPLQ
jgi:NAD(P)H-flavin reductase